MSTPDYRYFRKPAGASPPTFTPELDGLPLQLQHIFRSLRTFLNQDLPAYMDSGELPKVEGDDDWTKRTGDVIGAMRREDHEHRAVEYTPDWRSPTPKPMPNSTPGH